MVPRLPDGSEFKSKFNEKLVSWAGSLTIYDKGLEVKTFYLSHPGVFGLMRRLDKEYRKFLAKRDGTDLANGNGDR